MTLIEIMIVLALIVGVTAVVVPRLTGRNDVIKKTVRALANLSRELRDAAQLQDRVYRIVFYMPEKKVHSYVVESANKGFLLRTEEQEESLDYLSEMQREQLKKQEAFSVDKRFFKKPIELPEKMKFLDIEVNNRGIFKEKEAYIYFFPQGLNEEAVIHIGIEELRWSIVIHPLTGRSIILSELKTLKDLSSY